MDDSERTRVREAAGQVEAAHFTVNELLGTQHQGFAQTMPEHITPKEMAALKRIDANLRATCNELWNLCEAASAKG